MVLAELVGSAALGASGIWSYNRKNFMYDREMRQHQEFQIIEMKLRQAELWREDIRDMIGLTEKKMDSYTVVNALQLGFTVALLAEGRLEPGTPEWLLWLYMVSLSGAFMMLLMSVWFAMHASVVAQCNSVRLLTQLIRLPIPSWEQLEATRTYGYAFEGVPAASMMRVPLLQTISEADQTGSRRSAGHAETTPGIAAADPWGLERRGDDIYELQRRPITNNRHTHLVQEAARHWQAYDAFSRVAMTLGTILLCMALSYYVLGYILVQDGCPWAAWVAVSIFMGIASTILRLDLSLTRKEKCLAQALLIGGPVMAGFAAADWAVYSNATQSTALAVMPLVYLLHSAFLLDFAHLCRITRQPGGTLLPTTFRSVLYLDIFGWLMGGGPEHPFHMFGQQGDYQVLRESQEDTASDGSLAQEEPQELEAIEASGSCRQSQHLRQMSGLPATCGRAPVRAHPNDRELRQLRQHEVDASMWPLPSLDGHCSSVTCGAAGWVQLSASYDHSQKVPYHVNASTGDVCHEPPAAGTRESLLLAPSLSSAAEQVNTLVSNSADGPAPLGSMPQPVGNPVSHGPPSNPVALGGSDTSGSTSRAKGNTSLEQDPPPGPAGPTRIKRHLSRIAVAQGQNFPRHTLKTTAPAALRPDDVDTALHGPEDPHGSRWAVEDAARHLHAHLQDLDETSKPGQAQPQLLGIGPAGVIPEASKCTFEPKSFAPKMPQSDAARAIVSGHDSFLPGQLPWHIFRSGIWLLAGLWFVGAVWSIAQFLRVPDIPDQVLPESVSISGAKVEGPEWLNRPPPLTPTLPAGKRIHVQWPNEHFQPTGISCDAGGRHFTFSDEFQLYYASLPASATAPASELRLRVRPAPVCGPLEGQAIQDVAVLCGEGQGDSGRSCRALVLHAQGRLLAECELVEPPRPRLLEEGWSAPDSYREHRGAADVVWEIADKWLQDDGAPGTPEQVVSVAIDGNCGRSQRLPLVAAGETAMLHANRSDSCVVVGTSRQRVVKLRRHRKRDWELVPSGALWNARGIAEHREEQAGLSISSPLQILPGSYLLVLRDGMRSLQAIGVKSGRVLGKWMLPQQPGRHWSGLAGGANHFYLTSLGENGQGVELWQFSLPKEVKEQ